jgi:S1-C subfamily serine protease
MAEQRYYVRVRGKILGPFDLEELAQQRERGQVSRFHELSLDRVKWVPASSVQELFPAADAPARSHREDTDNITAGPPRAAPAAKAPSVSPEPIANASVWYFLDARKKQQGPYTPAQIHGFLEQEVLGRRSLVWNPAMTDWLPLESVPELGVTLPAAKQKRSGAVSSLALCSLIASVVWAGGFGSAAGIVLGIFALRQISDSRGALQGRWMALAGIIWGGVAILLTPIAALVLYYLVREPSSRNAEQLSELYKEKVYLVKTSQGTGSGILIANNKTRGLIATNLHVLNTKLADQPEVRRIMRENGIKKDETVEVKNSFQVQWRTARCAAYHRDNDLALLIIEMDNVRADAVRIIRKDRLHDGEPAVALGYPLGLDYKVSPGFISGTSLEEGAVWTTCPINPGNSGGPLFLERGSYLAGLATFKKNQVIPVVDEQQKLVDVNIKDTQNLNGAEPAEELVLSLQNGRTDKWIWAMDLKDLVTELARKVSVGD